MKTTIVRLALLSLAPIPLASASSNYVNASYGNVSGSGQYASVDFDG